MKKIVVLFTVLLSLQLVSGQGQSNTEVLKSLQKSHPRLLLLKGEEQEILSQIQKHTEWNAVHQEILAECNKLMDTPPVERIKIGRRLLDKSRECVRRVFQLSYAYRTTKDEKYLRRSEKEMLAVAAFEDWNPMHFLDVAEMTMAVAIGYDWLYDGLTEEARTAIKEAILKKGIEPSFDKKYNSFLTSGHNWNQVCNAGISFGALAIAESEP